MLKNESFEISRNSAYVKPHLQVNKSNPPTRVSVPRSRCSRSSTFRVSVNIRFFKSLSSYELADKLGDAFTSISQVFNSTSNIISYPYNSKQCLSFIILSFARLNLETIKFTRIKIYSTAVDTVLKLRQI